MARDYSRYGACSARGMVKRDDNTIETTLGSVRDTVGRPADPSRPGESGEDGDHHEARYRPEMGTIVPADNRLRQDGR